MDTEKPSTSKQASSSSSMDIRTKTGGAYIPPAKLRLMQQSISDKNSEAYQRLAWEGLKKSINGLINKVNIGNIAVMVKELFQINLIRGRGLFCRAIMRAQMSSPTFTHVYAALVAVCNTKFPRVGELLIKRLIIQFRRSYNRNDKSNCINTVRFIAHLVNQSVVHEVLSLEILVLLLENTTDDSVEVAIAFLKECGAKLDDVARKATAAIFETLRNTLHDAVLDKRVQYMIEVMFAVRRDKFKDHPSILPELDLVEEADQVTHQYELLEDYDSEDKLNVFQLDPNFQENEEKYDSIKNEILGDASSDGSGGSSSGSESDDESDENDDEEGGDPGPTGTTDATTIIDNTETNLIALRKTIYLTIQSSLDFEECAHKLMKLEMNPAHIPELCNMIVDCCAQQRTYIKFYGLLAQRFCQLSTQAAEYVKPFADIFQNCYDTIHRFETCKMRNVAKLFAHLLHTDSIPWTVLAHIKLTEEDTTSSSRVFIKILFQQLAESLGLVKLNARIKDATLQEAFDGLFPRDNPANTRFAINFFTSIGLGGLTDDLREHLKTMTTAKPVLGLESLANKVKKEEATSSSSSDSSSSDSSDSDSSSSSDSSSDEDSDDESSDSDDSTDSRDDHRHPKHLKSRNERTKERTRNENLAREADDDDAPRSSRRRDRSSSSRRREHRDAERKHPDRSHRIKESSPPTFSRRGEKAPTPPTENRRRGREDRDRNDDRDRRDHRSRREQRDASPKDDARESRRHLKERNIKEELEEGEIRRHGTRRDRNDHHHSDDEEKSKSAKKSRREHQDHSRERRSPRRERSVSVEHSRDSKRRRR